MKDETVSDGSGAVVLNPVDDQIYRMLRQEIVQGALAPDSTLRLRDLAARFQVSTTPVREALERLKSDGLCTQAPHRGTRVVRLSRKEFEDIYAVRMGLEGQAVRQGLAQIDDARLVQIRENWRTALALWDDGQEPDLDRYLPLMNSIYTPCFEAMELPRLFQLILDYRRYAERYLRVALTDLEVLRDDVVLHEAFVIACERRDADEAERTARRLLGWTVEQLRGRLSE